VPHGQAQRVAVVEERVAAEAMAVAAARLEASAADLGVWVPMVGI
jgi:hypothetical protein